MASNPPPTVEGPCNTETDEETIALRKKRSRRVSFADREITSVHIFNRDEDFETPPDSSATKPGSDIVSEADNEVLGFFRDLGDSDDSKEMSPTGDEDEDEDDEIVNSRRSFLRPVESPSPGSSIVGSATSNDEDNFFGPVSANFIRPGRLSDSAASDDNHDVTMDSTAFSMHYRSLARSDSGGNTFEEKTPSHITTPSDSGSFMVLTEMKKMSPHFSSSAQKISRSRDSNDMTLVGENPCNYGYGELSPTLEALLAEGSKDLQDLTVSDPSSKESLKRSHVSTFDENLSGQIDQRDCKDKETGNDGKLGLSPQGLSTVCVEMDGVNCNALTTLVDQITSGCSSHRYEVLAADTPIELQMQTPNQLSKGNNNYTKNLYEMNPLIVEFSSGDHQSINGEVLQLDSVVQHESKEDPFGNSHENSRANNGIYKNFDEHKSPLLGSLSSVSTKQQQIPLDTAKSHGQYLYVTPSPKQPTSLLDKQNMKSGDNFLSVNKSISKFQIFQPSPLASALKDGIERSKVRLSKLVSSTVLPSNSAAKESCRSTESKNVDAIVANLEKRLSSVDQNNRHRERIDCMDKTGIQEKERDDSGSKTEGTKCLAEHGESLIPLFTHIFSDGVNMTEVASPSKCTQLQEKDRQHSLMPDKFVQQEVVVSRSDSSLIDFKLDTCNDVKKFIPPDPPAKTLLSSSTELKWTPLHDLQPDELVSIGLGKDKSSVAKSTNNSTSTAELMASFAEGRAQSSSSLVEINGFQDFNQMQKVYDRQTYSPALRHASESLPVSRSPLRERNAKKFSAGSSGGNVIVVTDRNHHQEEIPGECSEASASDDINRRITCRTTNIKSPLKKKMTKSSIEKLTHSPSRKDLPKVLNNDNMQSLAGKIIVPTNSASNGHGDSDSHLNGIPVQNIENSSERKRRFEEPVAEDADCADKCRRIKRSPDIHQSQDSDLEFVLESNGGSDSRREMMIRSDKTIKHWREIMQKFSTDTEQLVSPLTGKLNIRSISLLQDIVLHLRKIKNFEMLSPQIQCQKLYAQFGEIRHNRVAETKMLFYKLAYEKARLQLLSIQREKVLKRAEQLSSAVHKSQILKLNRTCLFLPGDGDTAFGNHRRTSNMSSKHEVSREKLTTMKQDIEVLDKKIKNLTKILQSYRKMKGELSFSETMALLNDHLKKKMSCKIIHEDLQLWEVDGFGSRNMNRDIVLNYRGLISQRFVINDGPTPSVFISNSLDAVNITKNFPNMEACTAFAWVLNAKTPKKLVGFKSFAHETQSACSLLHNLLDVIGEVQLALVEIQNLVQTNFSSYSVGQLDLQLCFIDINNSRKVIVTLDMTCLNRGVYPSDILPYRLQASIAGECMSVPESVSARITAAVGSLGSGYSRIIRLCRWVPPPLSTKTDIVAINYCGRKINFNAAEFSLAYCCKCDTCPSLAA